MSTNPTHFLSLVRKPCFLLYWVQHCILFDQGCLELKLLLLYPFADRAFQLCVVENHPWSCTFCHTQDTISWDWTWKGRISDHQKWVWKWTVRPKILVRFIYWLFSLCTVSLKVAPYSFTIARVLMTKAQVICARSEENISVFRFLWRQHEHKKQNWQ